MTSMKRRVAAVGWTRSEPISTKPTPVSSRTARLTASGRLKPLGSALSEWARSGIREVLAIEDENEGQDDRLIADVLRVGRAA